MVSIGEFIKSKRTELGFSQKKLGSLVNLSDSEIMKIENGTRKTPNWESLCKIAHAFKISPLEMLLVSGYISKEDINPSLKVKGLEKLNEIELENVQLYIDFIISRKNLNQEDT